MSKNLVLSTIKFLFGIGVISWFIYNNKIDSSLTTTLKKLHFFIPLFICILLCVFFQTIRWWFILKKNNFQPLFINIFRYNLIGSFFSHILPGGIGGDVIKGYYTFKSSPNNSLKATSTVLADRIFGLVSMISLAFLLPLGHTDILYNSEILKKSHYFIGTLFVSIILLSLLFQNKKINTATVKTLSLLPQGSFFVDCFSIYTQFIRSPLSLLFVLCIGFLSQLLPAIAMWYVSKDLGYSLDLYPHLILSIISFLLTTLPLAPAGIGVGQFAFYFIYNEYLGYASQVGPTLISAIQIVTFTVSLVGFILFLFKKSTLQSTQKPDNKVHKNGGCK